MVEILTVSTWKAGLRSVMSATTVGWFGALFVVEVLVLTLVHSGDRHINHSLHAFYFYFRQASLAAMLLPICFIVLTWLNRQRLRDAWLAAQVGHSWKPYLVVNLVCYGMLLLTVYAIGWMSVAGGGPPNWTFWPFCLLLFGTVASLVLAIAPPRFWLTLWRNQRLELAIAVGYSTAIVLLMNVMQRSWEPLSTLTLSVVEVALWLLKESVEIDYSTKEVYFRDFAVRIDAQCSGYEGIGLVVSFLTIFIYAMRKTLRFPNALFLLPIGVVTIWCLNLVRVFILIVIGGYVSPSVAIDGFHSQAGWLAFLAVTVGLMWVAYRSPIFNVAATADKMIKTGAQDAPVLEYLAPFMALLAANILASTAAPYEFVFYPLVPVFVFAALWKFRHAYRGLLQGDCTLAIVVGVGVGVLWVVTHPSGAGAGEVSTWLNTLPLTVAIGWVLLRGVSTICLVPIAEELAFRGYFHRVLQSRDWYQVPIGQASVVAFVVTSVCFGLLHQRWLAGALAGAVFALIMYRSNRLADPIAAHAAANAVIFGAAVAWAQWDLI